MKFHQLWRLTIPTLALWGGMALLTMTLGSCGYWPSSNIETIAIAQLHTLEEIVWVDVRTKPEHKAGHIPGSLWIPWQQIRQGSGISQLETLAHQHPDATIVLYCELGPRSYWAIDGLADREDINVVALIGGIQAWKKQPGAKIVYLVEP